MMPKQHILLCDEAHQRRIDPLANDGEYAEFVRRVGELEYDPGNPSARMVPFEVELPEWPPVERTPLAFIFGSDGPFADMPWKGLQLAVERTFWTRRAISNLAKDMVPVTENFEAKRLAYQWQCEIFDSELHVVIRTWCAANGVDIVQFWRGYYPTAKSG